MISCPIPSKLQFVPCTVLIPTSRPERTESASTPPSASVFWFQDLQIWATPTKSFFTNPDACSPLEYISQPRSERSRFSSQWALKRTRSEVVPLLRWSKKGLLGWNKKWFPLLALPLSGYLNQKQSTVIILVSERIKTIKFPTWPLLFIKKVSQKTDINMWLEWHFY